jgi:hypothetical protein
MVLNKCPKCGSGNLKLARLARFKAESLGIDGVEVVDAVEEQSCGDCHAVISTEIPQLAELIAATAVWRVMIPIKLNGEEIRFLRQALELQSKELASVLSVEPETVSRWENREQPITEGNEKNLRQMVGAKLGEQAPGIRFDSSAVATMKIQGPRPQPIIPMSFCRVLVAPEQEAWNARKMATG